MSSESWLSRIRKNREIRRVKKLRKKYEFLINELYTSQDRVVTKVIGQETENLNLRSEQLESRIIHSINLLETNLSERSTNFNEHMLSLQNEQQISKNEIKVILDAIMKKLEEIETSNCDIQYKNKELLDGCSTNIGNRLIRSEERIISQISETSNCTQRRIECVQAGVGEQSEGIHRVLKSIISKIEAIQDNTFEQTKTCNAIVENKSNSILLSIDEVKSLMKIVAVNNLLDEM